LRSYLDGQSFLIALDKVVSNLFGELWKFISTPLIFVSLIVALFVYTVRENILLLFPAIKEISAGSFSAKIEYPHSGNGLVEELSAFPKLDQNKSDFVAEILLNSLREETLLFLLYMNKKDNSVKWADIFSIMEQYKIGTKSINNYDKLSDEQKRAYLAGTYHALKGLTFKYIFDYDKTNQTLTLKSKALEVITKKLEKQGSLKPI
jgi:hypothetical protein